MHRVKGYFRLLPKGTHEKAYVFDVCDDVQVIARRSLGLLQALERERYSFRLLAFNDMRDLTALRAHAALGQAIDSTHETGPHFSHDLRSFLSAYLNTAKRVISLRALCGGDSVVMDRLKLVFNGMPVSWNDFYYEEERFLAAYRWIGQPSISFPIALVGNVCAIQIIPRKDRSLYVRQLKRPVFTPCVFGTNVFDSGAAFECSRSCLFSLGVACRPRCAIPDQPLGTDGRRLGKARPNFRHAGCENRRQQDHLERFLACRHSAQRCCEIPEAPATC